MAAKLNFYRLAAGSYFGAWRYTSRRRSIKERRSKNTLEKVVYSDARSARDTGTVLGEDADYIYQCGDTLRTHVGITSTSNKCQKLRVINMGACLANVVLCFPPPRLQSRAAPVENDWKTQTAMMKYTVRLLALLICGSRCRWAPLHGRETEI